MNDKKTVFFETLAPEQDLSIENGYKSNDIGFEVEIPIIVQKSESKTCMLKPGSTLFKVESILFTRIFGK